MKNRKFSALFLSLALLPFAISLNAPVTPAAQDLVSSHHFQVNWGGSRMEFQSVEGLNTSIEVIEYRDGLSPTYTPKKVPGSIHTHNIVLRRVIEENDNELWNWFKTVLSGKPEYRDVTISILNDEHSPVVTYKIQYAWPCAYRGPALNGTKRDLAFEELELAHNGMTVSMD